METATCLPVVLLALSEDLGASTVVHDAMAASLRLSHTLVQRVLLVVRHG